MSRNLASNCIIIRQVFYFTRTSDYDYVHTALDEFETMLKFVWLVVFTRNRTNYRPKSVHTEADEFVHKII